MTTYDLTLAQNQIWLSQKLLGSTAIFNLTVAYHLPGQIDPEIFTRAFDQLVAESDCLRLELTELNGRVVQTFLPEKHIPVEIIDFRNEPDPKAAFDAWGKKHAKIPIEFDNPYMKCALVYVNSSGAYWATVAHHILFDGWGFYLHYQRLLAIYQELASTGVVTSPPLPSMQYLLDADREYCDLQVFQDDRQYWLKKFESSAGSPKLYGRACPGVPSECLRQQLQLPLEVVEKMRVLMEDPHFSGRTLNIALLNIFMTAFCAYLYRVSGQRRIMVSVPFRNRHEELAKIPGLAVGVVPIQVDIDEHDTFRTLHEKVVLETRETSRHSRYLISNPHNRYYNAILNFHNRPYGPDSDQKEMWWFSEAETDDIVLNVLNPDMETGQFDLGFDLNATTFDGDLRAKIPGHFINLMRNFLDHPDQRVDAASVLSAEEKRQILYGQNPPPRQPSGRWFGEMFAERAALHPDAAAVEADWDALTYRQLDERSSRLATYLAARGAAPGKTVGLFVDRSLEMAVGMLAILKSGATYVPLDPTYPLDRLNYMAVDAELCLLLTRQSMLERLPDTRVERICLDQGWEMDPISTPQGPIPAPQLEDPAYITYTSGSTGRPKGVVTSHASLASYLEVETDYLRLKPGDRILFFAAQGFDASLEEILPAWLSGATVVIRPDGILSLAQFNQLIQAQRLTALSLPAAYWGEWTLDLETRHAALPDHLRTVMVYAEEPNICRFQSWLNLPNASAVRWINTYGPTETAITATVFEPTAQDRPETWTHFPIGKPLANHAIYILNSCGDPEAAGAPGEIYISGDAALGYLHMPRETGEKFSHDPFWPTQSRRMYRTGDFGRYLPDGNIEFLGRMDGQVKLYGFRIELGEIENRMCGDPEIRQVVVDLKESAEGVKRLVAYLTLTDHQPLDLEALRARLKQSLPHYMIPAEFIVLDDFPISPNGKIDRNALPETAAPSANPDQEFASTPTQEKLAAIWEKVIGVSRVGIDSNFFDLGGDSLLGMRMLSHIDQEIGIQIPVDELFQSPTIRKLSRYIEKHPSGAQSSLVVKIRAGGPGRPLFLVHGWGGGIIDYYNLAKTIGDTWPIYGIQAAGRDGKEAPDETIDAMSNRYYEAIKQVQPEGPYRLGGYCQGGVVAYELACLFESHGDQVEFVGIIDASAPAAQNRNPSPWSARRLLAIGSCVPFWLKDYRDLGFKGIRQRIRLKLRQMTRRRDRSKGQVPQYKMDDIILDNPTVLPENQMKVLLAGIKIVSTYRPNRFSKNVVVYAARYPTITEAFKGSTDPTKGWQQLVEGEVKVHLIDCAHRNIHLPPYCYQLAEKINEELRLLA